MSTPSAPPPLGGDSRLTLDDILTMKTISQPALSHDGRIAAFVLREASSQGQFPTGQICLLPVDGPDRQAPRPFTTGGGLDSAPCFSPDGRSLAFLSDREKRGTAQLYVIALSGGEAVRVTNERGGVAEPRWSPDGSWLSYLAVAAPAEDAEQRKKDGDDAKVASEIQKRRRLWICAPDGSQARALTDEDRSVFTYAWAPNSRHIALHTASTPEANAGFGAARLGVLSLDATEPERDFGSAMVQMLIWALDGTMLITQGGSVPEFPQTWLTCWPLDGSAPRQILRDLPATPFWLGRPPAAEEVLVVAWQSVYTPIYRVRPVDGHVELLVEGSGSIMEAVATSADGTQLVMVRSSGSEGTDLWFWEAGGSLRQLTDANPWLAQRTLGCQREFRWTSFDGTEIGGHVITPPNYQEGQRYPLVVNVHGGPTWLWTDHLHANWHDWGQLLASAGFVVLLPNPRGSAGRGNDFAHANIGDLGGGDYRDVMAGVDALIAQGLVDQSRMGIGGWSYGGTLTPWTISQTTRFKAAVMGAGICNWVSFAGVTDIRIFADRCFDAAVHLDATAFWERSALRHVARITTPTLIVHGEADVRVPVNQAYEMYSALRHMGVPTELVVYPREGHAFVERHHQRDLQERIRAWFEHYLLSAEDESIRYEAR